MTNFLYKNAVRRKEDEKKQFYGCKLPKYYL